MIQLLNRLSTYPSSTAHPLLKTVTICWIREHSIIFPLNSTTLATLFLLCCSRLISHYLFSYCLFQIPFSWSRTSEIVILGSSPSSVSSCACNSPPKKTLIEAARPCSDLSKIAAYNLLNAVSHGWPGSRAGISPSVWIFRKVIELVQLHVDSCNTVSLRLKWLFSQPISETPNP